MTDFSNRHPSTQEKLRWLVPNPNLPDGTPAQVSEMFHDLSVRLAWALQDGPQLTIGLQRLIDAKDALVRQAIADGQE